MDFQQLLTDIKQQKFKPVYLLHGQEPYFIDTISKALEKHTLTEEEKSFNLTVMYGKDSDVNQLMESAKRYPMMAERQVVIVKEAQGMRNIEAIESYLANPLPTTVLVIAYKGKKVDGRKKWLKLAQKNGVEFFSKPIYENQVPAWVEKYLKGRNYQISPKAAALIAESLGTDLAKITNELDKLMLNVEAGTTIDENHVETNIGVSKDFNNFELQNAIGHLNHAKAQQIALYFAQNTKDHPPIVTISVLMKFFTQVMCVFFEKNRDKFTIAKKIGVNPYFAGDYITTAQNYSGKKVMENITLLREYDGKIKGVETANVEQGDLVRELVWRLMN